MNEIFKRINITDGNRRIGYASVRYPVTENKSIDKYYSELAKVFLKRAEKDKHTGMLTSYVGYEDEECISIITEARLYKDAECIRRHRSGFVWDRKYGILRYLKKRGIRCCNLICNGRELKKFD